VFVEKGGIVDYRDIRFCLPRNNISSELMGYVRLILFADK